MRNSNALVIHRSLALRTLVLVHVLLSASFSSAFAQTPPNTAAVQTPPKTYDPRLTFAPLTLPSPVNSYRSASGAPGPAYWQNEADYEMHATLDTTSKTLSNDEVITYTNNSPDVLPSLWIQLEQNSYRKDSRSAIMSGGGGGRGGRGRRGRGNPAAAPAGGTAPAPVTNTDGFIIESVTVDSGSQSGNQAGNQATQLDYLVSDTRMQVRLAQPLKSHASLKLHIKYHYQIPGTFGGRTSWGMSRQGEIYDIAQWYPRMCVYDDLRGWDTLPYVGSEFYLEYGHFDYYLTLPSNMLVAGSGELMNPADVLTPTQIERLAQARKSDKTISIRTAAEVSDPASRPKPKPQTDGTLTWHFQMDHTRDVVWSASPIFIWDAARINLPDGKTSLAMSFYPPESVGPNKWDKSTEYVKDSIENFSKWWFPYPWPAAINVAGFSSGMEYPGIVFDGIDDKDDELFWVTAHEIGHTWFPMIVGSNERRHAFMDEGFNTFIDIDESAAYAGGKYGPKRDSEYSAGGEPPDTILKVLDNPDAPTIMSPADGYTGNLSHPVSYFKAAYGMVLLREQILGKDRFDWAFRKYIRDWAYKHPSPSDFFREMQSEGGEDLTWFWRGWYMENWKYDVSVDGVEGSVVTIGNRGQLVLPTPVEVAFVGGTKQRVTLPVETWMSKTTYVWRLPNKTAIASVTVDPDHMLPDDNRANNAWKAK